MTGGFEIGFPSLPFSASWGGVEAAIGAIENSLNDTENP
jgi:hypothetical protein